ncbi:DUF6950 family protein [Agrobacterium rosae]|uniref:DUF6950 domain-containing protein n=1 Tax=Agrobacterium rosae TaxID=1972867 RepID=A0ABU4VVS8_9HYPH|nr:hypothetical protein [Agrobacterium rosae]MDX8329602.1 hypothetical protein [Agrobacterium rosae]
MTLQEFLALPHRFRWGGMGGDDCTTFCASWIERCTGTDPAASFRGSYRDAEGAARILAEGGGPVRFAARMIEPLGFVRIQHPHDGDVAVVTAPAGIAGEITQICAIRFGPLWASLGPSGVVAKRLDYVAAWRLGR